MLETIKDELMKSDEIFLKENSKNHDVTNNDLSTTDFDGQLEYFNDHEKFKNQNDRNLKNLDDNKLKNLDDNELENPNNEKLDSSELENPNDKSLENPSHINLENQDDEKLKNLDDKKLNRPEGSWNIWIDMANCQWYFILQNDEDRKKEFDYKCLTQPEFDLIPIMIGSSLLFWNKENEQWELVQVVEMSNIHLKIRLLQGNTNFVLHPKDKVLKPRTILEYQSNLEGQSDNIYNHNSLWYKSILIIFVLVLIFVFYIN